MAEAGLGQQLAQVPPQQRQVAALSAAIDVKLLAKKAEQANIQDSDEFKQQMQYLRERELHNLYFQEKIADAITEQDIEKRYKKEIASQPAQQEVEARHILVKTKKEAEDIIKKLDNGADFAKLAKDNSTGPSAEKGGELGYFTKGQMVPAFDKAAFSLKKGQYTEQPVETQFGWHVIKVEDKRDAKPPSLDQVSDQIRQVLLQERYAEVLQQARNDVKVNVENKQLAQAYDAMNAAEAAQMKSEDGSSGNGQSDSQGGASDTDSSNAK
ncbi:peptidylprolyl isomerase [Pararhizobium mangrovi]|uniref:Parvulin-like PPIase n=2 Tax=Pararhizobium mangrovi TaxID=2590452 RepID=A0A506TX38_9HYPH|nr:peptidylprolyl isomerase [Pararhizobium mangrovi]